MVNNLPHKTTSENKQEYCFLLLILIDHHCDMKIHCNGITMLLYKLFLVLSLAAALLLLPINRIIEVKSFTYPPEPCDPAIRGSRITSSINHSIHQGIGHQF